MVYNKATIRFYAVEEGEKGQKCNPRGKQLVREATGRTKRKKKKNSRLTGSLRRLLEP